MPKATYRPDIEGLRAIAILAVVACHAKLPFLQGGFVGVDIFFVISGHLITSLLVREFTSTGKVDFLNFYSRRLKRLLPGLAFMMLTASYAAIVILPATTLLPHAESAKAGIFWISNIHFALFEAGYFDAGSEGNLFLHTWSLGVEEQFYLVWPTLILLFMRGRYLLRGLIAVFVICLVINLTLSTASPLWAFYSMPSRGWQFALGGLVYVAATTGLVDKYNSATARTLAGSVGMLLILASITQINEQMTYPGLWAIIPSVGAALVILGDVNWLTVAPLRAIGRVSYSWYLWHWPVLILGGAYFGPGAIIQTLLVILSLVLAAIAYYAVESPLRNSQSLASQPRMNVLASLLIMVAGYMASNAWAVKSADHSIRSDIPAPYFAGCDDEDRSAQPNPCVYGDPEGSQTVVLFADSVGTQWFSALESKYTSKGSRLVVLVKSSCPIVLEEVVEADVCQEWKRAAIEYLQALQPDIVFIGSSIASQLTAEGWKSGTKRMLDSLSIKAKLVFVIRPTPRLSFDGPYCMAGKSWARHSEEGLPRCSTAQSIDPDNQVLASLQEAAKRFSNIRIVDFNSLVCPQQICSAHNGKQMVYRDNMHIADTFVKSISKQVSDIIDQAD